MYLHKAKHVLYPCYCTYVHVNINVQFKKVKYWLVTTHAHTLTGIPPNNSAVIFTSHPRMVVRSVGYTYAVSGFPLVQPNSIGHPIQPVFPFMITLL